MEKLEENIIKLLLNFIKLKKERANYKYKKRVNISMKKIFGFIALFIFLIIICNSLALAGGSGSTSPTQEGASYSEFNNPTNAYTQSDTYATGVTGSNDEQDYYGFDFSLSNFIEVLGISVWIDAYASYSDCYYNIKLSWDGGSTWTSSKKSDNLPTSDGDSYIETGSSSENWGRTWDDLSELDETNFTVYLQCDSRFSGRTLYLDHVFVYIEYKAYPTPPSNFYAINDDCNTANLSWIHPDLHYTDYVDYCLVLRNTSGFPPNINNGTEICNTTNDYCVDNTVEPNILYYYSIWGYNDTYNTWSTSYVKDKFMTTNFCPDYPYLPYNITAYTSNCVNVGLEWEKGIQATHTRIQKGLFGFPQSITDGTNVYNGTGIIYIDTDVDITNSYYYSFFSFSTTYGWNQSYVIGYYGSQCNYSLNYINNMENVTGEFPPYYTYHASFGYNISLNFTGNASCDIGIIYVNYSDENITFNVSVNCDLGTNTSNYTINETNWLSLLYGAIIFDNSQFSIMIQIIVFFIMLWLSFKVSPMGDTKNPIKFHTVPFIAGLYLLFAGLNFLALVYSLSSYVNAGVTGILSWFGIVLCILGIFKAFWYRD